MLFRLTSPDPFAGLPHQKWHAPGPARSEHWPAPPALLTPDFFTLPTGSMVYRLIRTQSEHPGTWNGFRFHGPVKNCRFEPHCPNAQGEPTKGKRGILYGAIGAEAVPTALAEAFQSTRFINRHSEAPVLCSFATVADLKLLDFTGVFPTRMGSSMAINTTTRPRSSRWARQLYESFPEADGIVYPSSMYANQTAVALFERSQRALPSHPRTHRLLSDPLLTNLLTGTASKIGYQTTRR